MLRQQRPVPQRPRPTSPPCVFLFPSADFRILEVVPASPLTRRILLRAMAAAGASLGSAVPAPIAGPGAALSPEDDGLLDEIEKACFLYFWEQAHPDTGLVKDRSKANSSDNGIVASIAATGFGLTALCIGEKRGWVSYPDARDRVVTTLNFLARKMPTHRGFFFHWANITTGERIWDAEVSSVDTAILLCGVLTARQHFRYAEITRLAFEIFAKRGLDLALGRHHPVVARLDARIWIHTLSLGLLQRADDDLPAGPGIGSASAAGRTPGAPGSARPLSSTGCVISAPTRLCSSINTRKRGSIFAISAIVMRIISRTLRSPPRLIASSAWN